MTRGKGLIFRAVRRTLPAARTIFEVEKGVLIEANIDDYLGREYFLHGLRRQPSFQLSRMLIRPDDALVDVGANVGYWVLGAAARLGAGGHAHAFEPCRDVFQALQENVRLNGMKQISCHRLALTDHSGEVSFRPSPQNTGHGALSPSPADPTAIVVPATTLDAFCERQGLVRIDLLKVDVEGAEESVFRGATSVLSRTDSPMLLFELGGGLAERYGSSAVRLKMFLAGFDYLTYRFDGRHLRRVKAEEPHAVTEDLFALKRAHIIDCPELAARTAREES
jgi:FkbM family methyltransferase